MVPAPEAEATVPRDVAVVGPVLQAIVIGFVVQVIVEPLVLSPGHRMAVGFAMVEFTMELAMLQVVVQAAMAAAETVGGRVASIGADRAMSRGVAIIVVSDGGGDPAQGQCDAGHEYDCEVPHSFSPVRPFLGHSH